MEKEVEEAEEAKLLHTTSHPIYRMCSLACTWHRTPPCGSTSSGVGSGSIPSCGSPENLAYSSPNQEPLPPLPCAQHPLVEVEGAAEEAASAAPAACTSRRPSSSKSDGTCRWGGMRHSVGPSRNRQTSLR